MWTRSATTRAISTTTSGAALAGQGPLPGRRGRRGTTCAIRVGVNCGSVDPARRTEHPADDSISPMLESALEHCDLLDSLGFTRYCVSLKDSDPAKVIEVNRRFAAQRPDVPLHLGVTEAGMPPDGILKTRIAFEQLISRGIGDTIRVSLTVPNRAKRKRSPPAGRSWPTSPPGRVSSVVGFAPGLNIISCPSCSRVENEAFVELAAAGPRADPLRGRPRPSPSP